eukprot:6146687-Prymnesium_polylepis.1
MCRLQRLRAAAADAPNTPDTLASPVAGPPRQMPAVYQPPTVLHPPTCHLRATGSPCRRTPPRRPCAGSGCSRSSGSTARSRVPQTAAARGAVPKSRLHPWGSSL